MNFPITLGWPQLVLLIIGLIGLWLFISAATSLLPKRAYLSEDEKERYREAGRLPRRRFRWKQGLGGILLLAVAISLLWLTFLVQGYLGLTGDIRVAQIRAHMPKNAQHQMSVELIVYDNNGHQLSDNFYNVLGDEWMLQADFIKFPAWMNILGFHSGYKITRLEGLYQDRNLESTARHTVVDLNGGEDNFFKTMRDQRFWFSPFVDAYYGNAAFEPADGTYDVYASQTGLYAKLVGP